jgi:nucleotide-binding universal stress UspA family protein
MAPSHFLVPHDGSPLATAVIGALEPLLEPSDEITLLHVVGGDGTPDEGWASAAAEAEERLGARGVTVTRREVRSDDPAGAIVDAAAEGDIRLVAMSTHGRTGFERWVRGSVAERVLRQCPVPLLMVNPFSGRGPVGRMARVLVPLDGSETSATVLGPLIPLARAHESHLTLLFVDWDDPTDTPEGAQRRREGRERDVAEWLAAPRAQAEAAGLSVEIQIARGDVAREILRLAVPNEFDLLALGTHGRSGPGRWVLGSIAEKVLRECQLPLLLARATSSA